jgi:hypothetical protein
VHSTQFLLLGTFFSHYHMPFHFVPESPFFRMSLQHKVPIPSYHGTDLSLRLIDQIWEWKEFKGATETSRPWTKGNALLRTKLPRYRSGNPDDRAIKVLDSKHAHLCIADDIMAGSSPTNATHQGSQQNEWHHLLVVPGLWGAVLRLPTQAGSMDPNRLP